MNYILPHLQKLVGGFLEGSFIIQQQAFKDWLKKTHPPVRQSYKLTITTQEGEVFLSEESKKSKPHFLFIDKQELTKEHVFFHDQGNAWYFDTSDGRWFLLYDGDSFVIAEREEEGRRQFLPPWVFMTEAEHAECLSVLSTYIAMAVSERGNNKINKRDVCTERLGRITRLQMQGGVGVSLFVRGILRGSMIVTGQNLAEGLIQAVERALEDIRFNNISMDEIPDVVVQVSLFSELFMPVLLSEIRRETPLPRKGYAVFSDKANGYYLPTVFGLGLFPTLASITKQLYKEKLGMSYVAGDEKNLRLFTVRQFYGCSGFSSGENRVFASCGVAHLQVGSGESDLGSDVAILRDRAYMFLLSYVAKGCTIPSICNIVTGSTLHNPTRQVFTLYAFVKGCQPGDRLPVMSYATHLYNHSVASREEEKIVHVTERIFFLVYRGMLARQLYGVKKDTDSIGTLIKHMPASIKEPLLLAMLAHFFIDGNDMSTARLYGEQVFELFRTTRKRKAEVPLADFIEVVYLAKVFSLCSNKEWEEMVYFFLRYQNGNGSFWSTTANSLGYARGTAKIIEVLYAYRYLPEVNQAIQKALRYIRSLTIDGDVLFLDGDKKSLYSGTVMESEASSDLFVDTLGHILLIR